MSNHKKTIVFYCFNFSMGGTETLILRLLEFYHSQNYRTILLTENPIHESISEDSKKVSFEHYLYDKKTKNFSSGLKKLEFENDEKPLVITQFLPEFLKCFTLINKTRYGVNFKHTLYIVHPNSTFYGPKKITFLAKTMIMMLLRKKVLVFMDETCVEKCIEHYNLKKTLDFVIYRLPIFINKNNIVEKKNEIFNILTITRFEFPFKAYVLGLINSFGNICEKYPSISLTIIGHGKGKKEVENAISFLSDSKKAKINIVEEIPYHKISDYIKACDVYVGMGTTVLDVANNNKIAITAVAYQNSNLAVGYFHDNHTVIGEVLRENFKYFTFDQLLEDVIKTDSKEFENLGAKSKKRLMENYDIEIVGSNISKHTESYLSFYETILISIFSYINLYSTRLMSFYQRKKI
ncbi:hypothetical protein BB050_02171 [Flavobacterium anhuiense]|uniref:Uncharacterized protein n=1 Tax=Flavobacterium anhuiense TaxID=459526 RepID=A0AAC9CZS1_9FLAO|nr:hypothetical protein [Flavobacterium anhuiense]AOC95287.1 hypothetical protein BB050_02171 [Flavobacterium anhuiense]